MGVYLPLPSAYQEVEYIQSSGTQYIDTGKTVSGDVKADYTYMPKETVTSSTAGGLLVFIDNDRRNNGFGSSNTYTYYGGNTSNNEGYTVGTLQQNVLCHDIVAKSGCSRTLNGTTVSYVPSSSYPSPTGTLKLFVSQRAGSIINYWKTRMYSFKRYDSGVLTQDLIPCYRKSDGVIGMYNLANDTFLVNQGTGTFSKGADVTAIPLKNAYIGEVYEYSYDFRGKTLAGIQADGWTYGGSNTPTINSGGISIPTGGNDSWNKLYCSPSGLTSKLSTANKITLEMFSYIGSASSSLPSNGVLYLAGPSSYTANGTGLGGGYLNGFQRFMRVLGTDLYRGTYTTPAGEYTSTVTIDLVNKTMRFVVNNILDQTKTITDAQITTIRTLKYIRLGVENTRFVRTIKVTVEY